MSNLWQFEIRKKVDKMGGEEVEKNLLETVVNAVGFWRKGLISDKEFQEFLEFLEDLGCESGVDLKLN